MARGWESKSIENQQEEASRETSPGSTLTDAERDAASARRTLELARASVEHDLQRAKTPAHREMLQRALDDLDLQIGPRAAS